MNEENAPPPAPEPEPTPYFEKTAKTYKSYKSFSYEGGRETPQSLWLISFSDLTALLLAFFVLMYSMSSPREEKWVEVSSALEQELTDSKGQYKGSEWNAGPEETIALQKMNLGKALNMNYLKTVLGDMLKADKRLERVSLHARSGEMALILPASAVFIKDSNEISSEGQRTLAALAELLTRLDNRIEITGKAGGQDTWRLALERSARLAAIIRSAGYARPLNVYASYDPDAVSGDTAFIIAPDDGSELQSLQFDSGETP